jgi:thymidylate synthase ThyX
MRYPESIPASSEPAMPTAQNSAPEHTAAPAASATDVYAVHGADPEVLAYAMAKYSRSSLSMRESLRELNSQRAEQFLNTFYFQYGHRSIADLAHIAFAVERLSLLAAITLVDEQRWDGQERSTRYQNFRKSGWYTPDFAGHADALRLYSQTVEGLFSAYEKFSQAIFSELGQRIARPEEMQQDAYDRTLRARAFDVARYLLPLATNTSLGQIVNARTLETQVSRLLTHSHAEVRTLGARLREAAANPAWNVQHTALEALQKKIAALDPALGEEAAALLLRAVKTAPTLVKYAAPVEYMAKTQAALAQAARELLAGAAIETAPLVDLIEDAGTQTEALEIDIAATLLYGASHHPYRQIRQLVAALSSARRTELLELGTHHRGRHDELLRAFSAGAALRFDICMDIGGFRDMHRHRRCIQIVQEFTSAHGFEIPEMLPNVPLPAALLAQYTSAVQAAHAASAQLAQQPIPEAAASAQYLLPLGTRCRALFKMDFAEAAYISELRSAPQGHIAYRRVAWEMYAALAKNHPVLARSIRVTDIHAPVDPLQR